jgi:aminoglycoside 6'-N-acetyltransferase I
MPLTGVSCKKVIYMHIVDLEPGMTHQAAALLVEGFKIDSPDAWPDLESALQEVREALQPGRICRAAVDERNNVLGWIGGISQYKGHVWELHPLIVDASHQRQGIGRALVVDFEARVRERGGLTILLGSDDETGMTSLAGINLFTDTWRHIAHIRDLRGHPYEFYQKLGFTIVGVVPDANGPGKPDIIMAKRCSETRQSPSTRGALG